MDAISMWGFAIVGLVLVGGSYVFARLRTQDRTVIHGECAAA